MKALFFIYKIRWALQTLTKVRSLFPMNVFAGGSMGYSRKGIVMRVTAMCCALVAFFVMPAGAASLALDAGSAVLLDMHSKRLLYEQDSTRQIPPASLTKVMSMFVVLDAVKGGKLSLRTPVRISKAAARTGGSTMRLKAGERVRLDDLLRGMAVASANDASAAVAEHLAGSQAAFVTMMNRKAEQIGMKSTVFKTPHGLPAKGQVTTAADMLRLACRYMEAHPSARYYHSTPAILHNGYLMQNTNKLLGHDSVSGLKTGFTRESGYNMIVTGSRDGREMVGALMPAPTAEARFREAQRLLEYGATFQAALDKETAKAKASGKQGVKAARTSPERPAAVADAKAHRAAKGKKTPALASVSGRQGQALPLPRRVLPQTASLSPSAQSSQLR
jgi:D-alanyl-D-alanine carboxypeptidase